MDLWTETIWDTSNDGIQYAKLEEANQIYDFFACLNPKVTLFVVVYLDKDLFPP